MIRNGSKRTISSSGEFGLLQIVLESATGKCETLVRVGIDSLHSIRVLKS